MANQIYFESNLDVKITTRRTIFIKNNVYLLSINKLFEKLNKT